ncbi:MoaD/ThiS family protein [Nitrospiraceae bacterium HYJII51-Mn-bac16s-1-B09]|uniref:Molybdopterin synthase sulfur carrier subunit n=2 Tax=Candidatus Manganitrophus noduliformans TaxID=2606439 RepID=A0A7X6DS21_9BACT|nr:MoaD/ThiS family protein [Candidatus Manganitrophus noduliformans]
MTKMFHPPGNLLLHPLRESIKTLTENAEKGILFLTFQEFSKMVKIRFFAVLKKIVGKEEVVLDVEKGTTLEQLLNRLERDLPPLQQIMKEGKVLISVNQEVVPKECLIQNGDEIAFLPPFAGG